jgi:site-specific DNA recombinase
MLVPNQYRDGGYTGANMDRPGVRQLLADIEAGKIDCVLFYKVDRLSRSLIDFARRLELFEKRGVTFGSTQQFNTDTPLGRLTLNILLSFAHNAERAIMRSRPTERAM